MRAGGRDHQRVAVGRRFGREFGGNRAVGARTIVNDESHFHALGQSLRQQARDDIGSAARRKRHDDTHRLLRIRLCHSTRCACQYRYCHHPTPHCASPDHEQFKIYLKNGKQPPIDADSRRQKPESLQFHFGAFRTYLRSSASIGGCVSSLTLFRRLQRHRRGS